MDSLILVLFMDLLCNVLKVSLKPSWWLLICILNSINIPCTVACWEIGKTETMEHKWKKLDVWFNVLRTFNLLASLIKHTDLMH